MCIRDRSNGFRHALYRNHAQPLHRAGELGPGHRAESLGSETDSLVGRNEPRIPPNVLLGLESLPTHGNGPDMPSSTQPDDRKDQSDEQNSSQKRNFWLQYARYGQLAFVLPASLVVGWLIGAALDHWLHTTWLYLAGILLGIAAGFIELIRTAIRDTK